MAWEIVYSSPLGAINEAVNLGDDKSTAERVFNWVWNGLLRNDYTSAHSSANPNLIRYTKRGTGKTFFVELREAQPEKKLMHWVGAVVMQEQHAAKVAAAKHTVKVTLNDGSQRVYPLSDERSTALTQFAEMVTTEERCGGKVWRGIDSSMKYSVVNARGITTYEMVEVQHAQQAHA